MLFDQPTRSSDSRRIGTASRRAAVRLYPAGRPERFVLTAKQAEQDDDQAEDHHQDAVTAGQRAVGGRQDQVVVPDRFLPPLQRRADVGGHLVARDQRCERLIGEDLEHDGGTGGQDRGEHG